MGLFNIPATMKAMIKGIKTGIICFPKKKTTAVIMNQYENRITKFLWFSTFEIFSCMVPPESFKVIVFR